MVSRIRTSAGEERLPAGQAMNGRAPAISPPACGVSVPAAIRFHGQSPDHDWPRVRRECQELLRYARQAIAELTGLEQICPDSPEWPKGQMAPISLPPCDPDELKRRLQDDYRVEVPIISPGGREFVRVSVQGYNTREDVEAPEHLLPLLTRH